ncbi:MAG: hypothetical protein RSD42_02270, partial [Oscillospiraceae bacterium]
TLYKVLWFAFAVLTFCATGIVIYSHGAINAGYVCVPMLLSITFMNLYNTQKKREDFKNGR